MPRIPQYDQQVTQSVAPDVKVETAANPQSQENSPLNQIADFAGKYFLKQKEEADKTAVQDAYSQLINNKNDVVYNPNTGAVTKKGRDAFGVLDSATKDFNTRADQIGATLSNKDQREAYNKLRNQEFNDLNGQLQKYVYTQVQDYKDQTTKGLIDSAYNDATINFSDPEKVKNSVDIQTAAILQHGQDNGTPAVVTANRINEAKSKTYSSVINQMLNNGFDEEAKSYYDQVKENLLASDSVPIEKSIKTSTTKRKAQEETSNIMVSTNDLNTALKKARAIKDPDLQDEVVTRVKTRFSELEQAKKYAQDQNYEYASSFVKAHPGQMASDVIPPSVWNSLTIEQQNTFRKMGTDNLQNDHQKWLEFNQLTPGQISQMSNSDFQTKYWSHFDKSHQSTADTIFTEAKKDPKYSATLSFNQQVFNTAVQAGYISTKDKLKQAQTLAPLEQAASSAIASFEGQMGRKATYPEQQKIINDTLNKKVFVDNLFIDSEKPVALLSPEDKKKAYVKIENIPKVRLDEYTAYATRKGIKITNSQKQRAYGAEMTGASLDQIKAILEGTQ